ncbi:uncharacterized protein CG4951 isoform X2 [Drosophila busckii]|uniref:uncharacterized protein CG4951 isoform X2 n=1 Tax=Drosophila busckii TaxID=30019 RepID=UPI00083E98F8|nr:uncharacterized protein CG4951 isoform X2 [Drosophila busckii]
MPFKTSGKFRAVLQQYKYKERQIICFVKIVPQIVALYKLEPDKNYNWMSPNRWTKLESSIWNLVDSIGNWEKDAPNIQTELIVDHIKVKVCANNELRTQLEVLLPPAKDEDLYLELTLEYMSISTKEPQQVLAPAPEVKTLQLNDMNEEEVLNTFENYREHFDLVAGSCKYEFDISSYMSIGHTHVTHILSKYMREGMMNKLTEIYCKVFDVAIVALMDNSLAYGQIQTQRG